ncbi:GDSL-like Lipase/Acylhydrolase [compost metagenome]
MSGTFYEVITRNTYTGQIEYKTIVPEAQRFDFSLSQVLAWGDSLTIGSGGGGTTYPSALSVLTNFTISNKGVGGETSTQIKNRLVAEPLNYSKSVIIWAGRNNYTDPTTVKADIATMISTIGHTRYLVLSILNGDFASEYINQTNYNIIVQLNNDLQALYGEKYIDIRKLLVNAHNQTAQDLIDFANDIPPTSLRSDQIHLNAAGYTKVAEFINQRLGWLYNYNGYIQSKDLQYYTDILGVRNQTFNPQNTVAWIGGGGEALKVGTNAAGADFASIGLYARTATSNIRSGLIGFTSAGATSFTIQNNLTGSNLYNTSGSTSEHVFTGKSLFLGPNASTSPQNWGLRLGVPTDNSNVFMFIEGLATLFPNPPSFRGASFRGSLASRTNSQSGDMFVSFEGVGIRDGGNSHIGVRIIGQASENWTDTTRGARWTIHTTNNGGTIATEKIRIDHDGSLLIGTITNSGFKLDVVGTVRVSGLMTFVSGVVKPIRTVTATTTALISDWTIKCDATSGAFTINLPAASTVTGIVFNIKKINNSANDITVDPNGAELIDGSATFTITTFNQSITIQSDGTTWSIIS